MKDIKREDELTAKVKAGKMTEKEAQPPPAESTGVRNFRIYFGDQVFNIGVEAAGGAPSPAPTAPRAVPPPVSAPAPPPKPTERAPEGKKTEPKAPPAQAGETAITAPMPGMIISYEVKAGDKVEANDVVVILEAMKMANAITTPVSGQVKAINFANGDKVARDDVLAIIG